MRNFCFVHNHWELVAEEGDGEFLRGNSVQQLSDRQGRF